jgi:hypothetical protein
MRVVTVARKPLSEGNVASNVLKHGTGAINIDGARVGTTDVVETHSKSESAAKSRGTYGDYGPTVTGQSEGQKLGRWPANLVLQHLPECQPEGTREVTGTPGGTSSGGSAFGQGAGWNKHNNVVTTITRAKTETVTAWVCAPGCPVAELDAQSGDRSVSGAARVGKKDTVYQGHGSTYIQTKGTGVLHNDSGGASRFFKQVK